MLFNNHPHLYAASARRPLRHRRGHRQDAGRLVQGLEGQLQRRQEVAVDAVLHRRRDERLPQILVRRGRPHQVSRDLGRVPRRRQEAQGQGPSARPGARPFLRRSADLRLSADVVLRRQRGRRERQGRRSTPRRRSSRSSSWPRCGRRLSTRAASPGTIRATTAPSCPARSRSTLNGASIYIEIDAQARPVQDRRRARPLNDRHPARAAAQGAGRASSGCTPSTRT